MKKGVFRCFYFTNFTGIVLCKSPCNFITKETLAQVLSWEFFKRSMSTFFTEHLWTTASAEIAIAVKTMKITTSQLTPLKVLPNSVTYKISIASTTTSSASCIRERIEVQNLDDAPSVDQGATGFRLKIDRKKLEQLLSVGYLVRKTAKE